MPRPKRPGAPEPKKRSRNGCWNCKARKVKCGEERPSCVNCQRTGEACDYSIRLNWEGRKKKNPGFETILFQPPSDTSSSSHRRPSDAKSISSTATTSRTAEDPRSPSTASSAAGERATAPRLEPQASSSALSSSSKATLPGTSVFSGQLASAPSLLDNAESPPLCSPDLASPVFMLPLPQANSASNVPGGYVTLPEAISHGAGAARPPPFKRLRYSVDLDSSHQPLQISSPVSLNDPGSAAATPRILASAAVPGAGPASSADSPLTPSASSPYSEDGLPRPAQARQAAALSSPGIRRMSVNSLLSGPPGPAGSVQYAPPSQRAMNARTTLCLSEVMTFYGVDLGFPDLDLGRNDDANAITGLRLGNGHAQDEFKVPAAEDDMHADEASSSGERRLTGPKAYYERPVPVRIPRDLEPLPAKLRENPMNLLYFHHFMNHTARALVPHDDQQSNPYRHVLPQMAVQNDNLLSLMLAYSASHRAHLLGHPEPATRIAHWVQDIFPALRRALNDPNQSISNANIATGIMLASLEIVSPTAFGYQIPWQRHLGLARDLIASRPDGIRWTRNWTQEDQVRAFLWSWLAYLDVMGTFSGGRHESSTAWILAYQKDEYEEEWDEIDCIMGVTTRGVYILAKIAELAKECDVLRASDAQADESASATVTTTTGTATPTTTTTTIAADGSTPAAAAAPARHKAWEPPKDIVTRAWALEDEANASMTRPPQPCKHLHASGNVARWEQHEMAALSEAFHWAGLVHLHRRVLAKPALHEDVQAAVLKIHACLAMVPLGGDAEASMLFPLFTAACETADPAVRARAAERLDSMGRSGFLQVARTRALIEQVWATGRPWEALLTTEFVG